MAKGTATAFDEYLLDANKKIHDLPSDVIKMGFVDDTIVPAADDPSPRWSDYSANEVSTAGGYPSGGIVLTNVTFTLIAGVPTLKADDIELAINASGFTDAAHGIVYNSSATNDEALGSVDFGGDVSEQAGPVTVEFTDGVVGEFPANVAA